MTYHHGFISVVDSFLVWHVCVSAEACCDEFARHCTESKPVRNSFFFSPPSSTYFENLTVEVTLRNKICYIFNTREET